MTDIWLREVDAGTPNACWVVCSEGDPGAVMFTDNGRLLGEAERALEPFKKQADVWDHEDDNPDSMVTIDVPLDALRAARNTLNKIRSRESNG